MPRVLGLRCRSSLLALAALAVTGCPGAIDDPDRFPPPECFVRNYDAPRDLFAERCATAGCHVGSMPAAGLDLAAPGVVSRLLDTPSSQCPGTLVDTASVSRSLLLDKVRVVPTCGQSMPIGGPPLTEDELSCLRQWVEKVATESN